MIDGHLNALRLGALRSGATEYTGDGAPGKGQFKLDDWQDEDGTWHQGLRNMARGYADVETDFIQGYHDDKGEWHRGFLGDLKAKDSRYFDEETGEYIHGSMDSRADLYVGKMRGSANQAFMDFSPDDATFTWVLGDKEHCDDCVGYSEIIVNSPKDEVIAVPGAGDSACLGNCGCTLVRDDGVAGFAHHDDISQAA